MKLLIIFSTFCLLVVKATAEGLQNENEAGVLIVGGSQANASTIPYQLNLQKNDTEYGVICGGVLVEVAGHQVGLTSSSCFDSDNTSIPWDVMAGYDAVYAVHHRQRTSVEKIIKHPSYKEGEVTNDIAVIFFQPFGINDTTKAIPLPGAGQTTPQGNMTVSGWGSFNYGDTPSISLRVLNVTVTNNTVCEQDYGKDMTGVFCARNEDPNKYFPYIGDEGGPAVSDAGYLAGIFIKADKNVSAIFTDVAYFMTWIDTTVKDYYSSASTPTTPQADRRSTTTPTSQSTDGSGDHSPDGNSAQRASHSIFQLAGLLLSVVVFRAQFMTPY